MAGAAALPRLVFDDTDAGYTIAALAVATGIAPSALMAESDDMLATMIAVLERQAEEMENTHHGR